MDIWFILLLVAFWIGMTGWPISGLFAAVVCWCVDLNEGLTINWGEAVVWLIAGPFFMLFAIMEIAIIFSN